MLNNRQVAEHLIRGRELGTNTFIVGTGVRLGRNRAKIYDETIPDIKQRWVDVDPSSLERSIGLVDKLGVPIFDNDVLVDASNNLRVVVKYSNIDKRWELTFVSGTTDIFSTDLSNFDVRASRMTVCGRYVMGDLVDGVNYSKPIILEAYNDVD